MSETGVKIIKNEVRCRDDTVPITRRFLGIVACSQPYIAVASYIYSFWHCVIPTSYFRFLHLYNIAKSALLSKL